MISSRSIVTLKSQLNSPSDNFADAYSFRTDFADLNLY